MRLEQVGNRLAITRSSGDTHHPGFFSVRCPEQRVHERTALTAPAASELEAGKPQLISAIQRAEQPETDRSIAAMPVVRPKDVPGE